MHLILIKMPTPQKNETKEDFIQRCIPIVIDEKTAENNEQAFAICNSMYEQSIETDAISGNIDKAKKQITQVFTSQRQAYDLIIEKYLNQSFDEGVIQAARDLSMDPTDLVDFTRTNAIKKTLVDNAIVINIDLFDSINKDITLFLTDIELNNIKFTSAGLKKEVQNIFSKYDGRLRSQVVTEITRSANQGINYGYKKSGIVVSKQWVAVIDGKTTGICRAGNGEIVPLGEPFSIGEYTAPFHINCRSKIVAVTLSRPTKS